MANNSVQNGTDTIRDLDRLTAGVKTQVFQLDLGGASTNAESLVTGIAGAMPSAVMDGAGAAVNSLSAGTGQNGLMVAIGATNFVVSSVNSSTAQLATTATFTGTIETIFNEQAISVLLTTDQTGTLTLNQYIDLAGTRKISAWAFTIAAGVPFSRCFVGNGNYFNLTFQNTGGSTTTTLNINTAYGTLPGATNLGNMPVSLSEVNGTALSLGQAAKAASLPVALASDQATAAAPLVVQLANSGKAYKTFWALNVASGTTTTETAITLTYANGIGAATSTAASFTPTNGKTFRITSITFVTRGNTTATAEITVFSLRVNTGGAVTTSSPINFSTVSGAAATGLAFDRFTLSVPDDGILEIVGNGTIQWGITANAVFTTNAPTWDVLVTGYEF